MLVAYFYSDHPFDDQAKARALFEFLNAGPAAFRPVGYDRSEPARKPYDPDNLDEPLRYLSGYPKHDAGSIGIKGKRHRFFAMFSWNKTCVRDWFLQLGRSFFTGSKQVETWLQFITELCERFPMHYGVAYPEEDWYAKHQLIQKESWGERQSIKGLEIDHCLPPMGWMTVFGRTLVDHFGRDMLTGLPSHRVIELRNGGLILVASEHPFEPEQTERLAQDGTAMDTLGRDYFFELQDLHKVCQPIPGVTGGGMALEPDEDEDHQSLPTDETTSAVQDRDLGITETGINELFAAYDEQLVRNIDEKSTTDFDDLAETVVVSLSEEVEEVNAFSRVSLEALDRYFGKHDIANDKYEFLVTIYIPALGAYVGQVLVRALGGKWVVDENKLTRSTVVIDKQVLTPFKTAFDAVFRQKKLTDIYDKALKGQSVGQSVLAFSGKREEE